MCGIVGVVGNITAVAEKIFDQLLQVDVVRGEDSTGVFGVDINGGATYCKLIGPPHELRATEGYKEVFTVAKSAIIGHNRWATQGRVTSKNAHPFCSGGITLVHNGTLDTTWYLTSKHVVDSAQIAHELSIKEPKEVLESLDGAFALVWHDSRDNTLNVARNDERPLAFAHCPDTGTGYLASEGRMLDWILHKNGKKLRIDEAKAGTLYTKDLGTDGDWTRTEFTPKPVYKYSGYTGTGGYPDYSGGWSVGKTSKNPSKKSNLVAYNPKLYVDAGLKMHQNIEFTAVSHDNAHCMGTIVGTGTAVRVFMADQYYKQGAMYRAVLTTPYSVNGVQFAGAYGAYREVEETNPVVEISKGEFVTETQYIEDVGCGCVVCDKPFTAKEIKERDMVWYGQSLPAHRDCYGGE